VPPTCAILLTPTPRRFFRYLGHSCRAEATDHARGHPSTDARHTDGSRGGHRATDPHGTEHRRIAPYASCSTRSHAKSDTVANARRRTEGWRLVAQCPSSCLTFVTFRRCPLCGSCLTVDALHPGSVGLH
jgi:hypothetical protein